MLNRFRRTALSAAGLVLLTALTTGCASSRSADRADFELRTSGSVSDALRELGWVFDWSVDVGENTRVEMVIPADDLVFAQDENNVFTVRDASTGAFLWSERIENPLTTFLGHVRADNVTLDINGVANTSKDLVLNCSQTEVFVRDLRSGELLDRQRLLHFCSTRPVRVGDELIFGALSGNVLFHDFTTGLYTHRFGMRNPVTVAPTLTEGDQLAFVSDAGDVAFIDARSADSRGRVFDVYAGTDHSPSTDGRNAYFASKDQSIYAFDTVTGERRWRVRTDRPITSPTTHHNGRVYAAAPENGLLSIDARTGDVVWTAPDYDDGAVIASINDELAFWDGRTLSLLDERTGDTIDSARIPSVQQIIPDGAFENPGLYVLTDTGALVRYRIP